MQQPRPYLVQYPLFSHIALSSTSKHTMLVILDKCQVNATGSGTSILTVISRGFFFTRVGSRDPMNFLSAHQVQVSDSSPERPCMPALPIRNRPEVNGGAMERVKPLSIRSGSGSASRARKKLSSGVPSLALPLLRRLVRLKGRRRSPFTQAVSAPRARNPGVSMALLHPRDNFFFFFFHAADCTRPHAFSLPHDHRLSYLSLSVGFLLSSLSWRHPRNS